jgi:hypothetical protein
MANSFEIKYIYDVFPDIDFTQDFVVCQEIVETEPFLDVQATEDKWGHILDSVKWNRKIQSIKYRQYKVKITLSRNIDISIIRRADYVSLTTSEGETFNIFDVTIDYTEISGGRNYLVEMTFKRDAEVNNHLSSDNCLAYKTAESATVNELSVSIDNPSFSFTVYTVTVEYDAGRGEYRYNFTVGNTNRDYQILYDLLTVGDDFYLHSQLLDLQTDDIKTCFVSASSASGVSFKSNWTTSVISSYSEAIPFVINFEPDWTTDASVVGITVDYDLYTFIQPIFTYKEESTEGQKAPDGIQENQKITVKDVCKLKFWVTDEELWKIEYISYALYSDLLFTFRDHNDILPSQVLGMYTIKDNNNLLNLYEFDFEILYNNKVVSYNR